MLEATNPKAVLGLMAQANPSEMLLRKAASDTRQDAVDIRYRNLHRVQPVLDACSN